ncbi:MAG: hypothetical protein R3Y29_07020 [bacterium]
MAKKEKGMIKSIIDKIIYGFGLLVVFALFFGFFITDSEEDNNTMG